ncbi:MAG TPA: transcription elongation factor GreA [Patescibacteria group bacterium]|nr:transcription elongation factor GreA [Patescibacteria group bacterium]
MTWAIFFPKRDKMSNYVTENGLLKLREQLKEIKSKMKATSQKIKEAREMGDLSENAEYHEAKNEQSYLMSKESELEQKIKNAQIISKECKTDSVQVGCTVEIDDDGEKMSYQIVGSDEADPTEGRISVDSPIGSALVGHKKGDTVKVKTPAGVSSCKVIGIR